MATTEDPKAGIDGAGEWRRELYEAKPERQGERPAKGEEVPLVRAPMS